jgi:murein DD-endopeptidase MepM/ murein hydrolase activator NlpD
VKYLFLLAVILAATMEASQLVQRIQDSKKTLQTTEAQKKLAHRQLSKIADSIRSTEKELTEVQKILDRLEKEKKAGEARYEKAKKRIDVLSREIARLDDDIKGKHAEFIRLLTDQFSIIIAMNQMNRRSEKSLILKEFYERYKIVNDRELKTLKETIDRTRKQKQKLLVERAGLKMGISKIVRKREQYRRKKAKSEKLLGKLAREEALYRKKLKNLITRQNLLRLTLAKLNILRKEEIEKARLREAERKAQLEARARQLENMRRKKARERAKAKEEGREVDYTAVSLADTNMRGGVKQYGSSYQKESIASYRGPKTISPISNAHIVKKFGTYVDPIYRIKIFNDSVTLKAPHSGAKVRNVLNGKIVYVGENSMLGKVVIIRHGGGLHTVYAGLSKISPLVHTGKRIRKGIVIGKVRRKLVFQATQNSRLINPLRLIRL